MSRSHRLIVRADQDNLRLDVYLASTGLVSRRKARDLLAAGAVYLNRHRVKVASRIVRTGNQVELYLPEALPPANAVEIPILYQDSEVVAVHKPPGMPVQPTRETDRGTVLEALRQQLGVAEPRVVHRLDRDTSGAVVVALTRQAAAGLSEQMANHSADRIYLAACVGKSQPSETLRHYLTPLRPPLPHEPRGPARVHARPVEGDPRPEERLAVTHVRELARAPGFTLLKVTLETGLTHQIRAQLAASGLPLVGDTRYGAPALPADSPLRRLALHAAVLRFTHPTTGRPLTLFAPVPDDLRQWLEAQRLWQPSLEATVAQPIPHLILETSDGEAQHHA